MKGENIFGATDLVGGAYRQEAFDTLKTSNTARFGAKKLVRTVLVAAAIVCLLIVGVWAADYVVNSPEQAKAVFQRELREMKELGLISPDVSVEEYTSCTMEESRVDRFFPGRIFHSHYFITACTKAGERSGYWIYAYVDMSSGKLTQLDIQAFADEDDEVVRESGEYKFYENYDDIFDPSLTVGEYCDMLAAYWGFSGWSLGVYDVPMSEESFETPGAETLVKDIPILNGNYYLPVYFEGDEGSAPRYIELEQFPDAVMLILGQAHALG